MSTCLLRGHSLYTIFVKFSAPFRSSGNFSSAVGLWCLTILQMYSAMAQKPVQRGETGWKADFRIQSLWLPLVTIKPSSLQDRIMTAFDPLEVVEKRSLTKRKADRRGAGEPAQKKRSYVSFDPHETHYQTSLPWWEQVQRQLLRCLWVQPPSGALIHLGMYPWLRMSYTEAVLNPKWGDCHENSMAAIIHKVKKICGC